MSSHSSVQQTFELVEKLRVAVRDFAAREEKLNSEFRGRISAEQQRRDKSIADLDSQLSSSIAEKSAAFEAAHAAREARYQKRKSQIREAHFRSQRQGLKRIEDKEGKRKHKLQMDTMQTNRNRKNGLAAAESACVEFKSNLNAENETLGGLEETARNAFKGYGKFVRLLSRPQELAEAELKRDEYQLLNDLRELIAKTRDDLGRFRKLLLPFFFKWRVLWFLLVLCQIPAVPVLQHFGKTAFGYREAGISVVGFFIFGFLLHFVGKRQSEPLATSIANALVKARKLHDVCFQKCETRYVDEVARLEAEFQNKTQWTEQEWELNLTQAAEAREACPKLVDEKEARVSAKFEKMHHAKLQRIEREHALDLERLTSEADTKKQELMAASARRETDWRKEYEAQWRVLENEWKSDVPQIYDAMAAANTTAEKLFPIWEPEIWKNWVPPKKFEHAAKFAHIDIDVEKVSGGIPKDKRLALPGPAQLSLPLLLTYPHEGSLLIETTEAGRDEAVGALNSSILRLLSVAPPGRLSFTIIDPVGLGQNFSGVMHLADYAEHLINSRIWTQTQQIEQKLADLNEHMEKVIQMYLRNEYETIAEYNEQAGNIAEKYHFLVVADFPVNFSDAAARRLLNIAASGARCGVYTLIHWNTSHAAPPDFVADEFRKSSVVIGQKGKQFLLANKSLSGTTLIFDPPPDPDFATQFVHKVGKLSRDSNRVEVPFEHVAPKDAEIWTEETTSELRVPIGRTGATKLQYLAVGKGTCQHALVAGKTGSGKSTLFHVIITNLALWCSPEQVEFYLIDFKKGVEFKCYATHRLPHARVVAIESDREFGLSVLQRLDEELRRRGDLFRKAGVQDLPGYKKTPGAEPLPRCLLMIDEFQEFFVEDDKVAQGASVLLDRLVRQGRAFGIHVILGSQTLGGAYTMARATIGQMVIRIALQCNEADAYLIMDDNNPAPRLLSRPGEGIYNDAAGNIEGNSPFQAVWISDSDRDVYLEKIRAKAEQSGKSYEAPIVFEGDAPADVKENLLLHELLSAESIRKTASPRIWLGAPNSIKGPTEAVFRRQSGNNLLIVGQRDEAVLAILSVGLVSLAAQHPKGRARFILFDANSPGSTARDYLERVVEIVPSASMSKNHELPEIINELAAELERRTNDPHAADAPWIYVFINGLQKFGKLRFEEDFGFSSESESTPNPGAQLNKIICEGAALGIHVIVTCDTYNNVNRFLSKKAFSEFEMRVLFQMSANDSASLIDNPKAGSLGLHRAIFYNEQEGYLEVFRPYAVPGGEWIEAVKRSLEKLGVT